MAKARAPCARAMCALQSPTRRRSCRGAGGGRSPCEPPEPRLVSVINKMLRDLDRRRALPESASADPNVRVVPQTRRPSDAFWITVAFEALVAVATMAWVAYQMQPRPIATPL